MIKGLSISPGLSYAPVLVVKKEELVIPDTNVSDVDAEVDAFKAAHQKAVDENKALYEKASKMLSEEDAAIFLAHEEMLLDESAVVEPIISIIKDQKLNAAKAIDIQMASVIAMFESIDDEYMKARALDAKDIRELMLMAVLGIEKIDLSDLGEDTIIVADEITPSDTATMDLKKVAGFITQIGGPTSHSAIIARNMEIPAVSNIEDVTTVFNDKDMVIIDGTKGTVEINPDESRVSEFKKEKEEEEKLRALYATYKGKKTVTAKGRHVGLFANIGSPDDVDKVLECDAEGIGLFRSEFLYMNTPTLPDEETQYKAYREVLEKMGDKPVIIRTLDIGGDKELPALDLEKEENPFLGYRALRICLDRPELFKTQLRALYRASEYGNLKVMFPMICNIDELRQAKEIANSVREELLKENPNGKYEVPLGMMIEIPAAAVIADDFAKEADFFSIGTNDLTQYTLAADRGNTKVAYLYDTANPAVLALIKNTIDAAHRNGIECGVCGEAGGDPALQPILVELGIDELSMSAPSILRSRMDISKMDC